MKLLLFATLLIFAVDVEADNKCSEGPNYWCSSVTIAEKCNQTKHCQGHAWKVDGEDNGAIIQKDSQVQMKQMCLNMDGTDMESRAFDEPLFWNAVLTATSGIVLEDVLRKAISKYSLKKLSESICSYAPCVFVSRCNSIAKDLFFDGVLSKRRFNMTEENTCGVCAMAAQILKRYSAQKPGIEVKKFLLMICDKNILPISNCYEQVETFFGKGWGILKNMIDSGEVCDMLQICKSTLNNQDGMCEICTMATNVMRPYIDGKLTSQMDLIDSLKVFCNMMPNMYHLKCQDLLRKIFDYGLDFINNNSIDELCTALRVCKSPTTRSLMKIVKLQAPQVTPKEIFDMAIKFMKSFVEKIPGIYNSHLDVMIGVVEQLIVLKVVPKEYSDLVINIKPFMDNIPNTFNSFLDKLDTISVKEMDGLCEGCKFGVLLIKPYTKYKMEIKSGLAKVCAILPDSFVNDCTVLLSFYDIGWFIMKQGIESGDLCIVLKICKDPLTPSLQKVIKAN